MIRANVIPAIRRTSEFPNPVFSDLSLPNFLNRFTYKLADLGLEMMNQAILNFRVTNSFDPKFSRKIQLTLYSISENFLKKTADFPPDSFFTGFWYGGSPEELSHQDIIDFILPLTGRQVCYKIS